MAGEFGRPLVLARERALALPGPLAEILPEGLQRGAVVTVDGVPGAGIATLGLQLAAAATAAGEWAAAVDPHGTLGGLAAQQQGVALERLAVIRNVSAARWPTVVAALLDGMTLVLTAAPVHARHGDARRLVARARERGAVLVVIGDWPAEAALRLYAEQSEWSGLGAGHGLLSDRATDVRVVRRGTATRVRLAG